MAALNFPDHNLVTSYTNPDTGITYEWTNNSWKAVRTSQVSSGSGSQTLVSDTMPAPAGYEVGTLWWNSDSTDTSLYVLYQDPVGPNGDIGGKYWIEAAPAPDSIGFNGSHTGDSTFTGNMNVTGNGTFGNTVTGQQTSNNALSAFEAVDANGTRFKVTGAGVLSLYDNSLTENVRISSDGSATFARAVNVNLAAGSTNGDFAVRSGTKKRVGIDAAGDIKLGDDIQSAQTILLRGSDGSAEFAGAVTSTEGFSGKYLTATTTTNTAGSVCLMISNSNGEIGRWRADNNFMIGGTPSSPVTANIHFNGNSGSATFAGGVQTVAAAGAVGGYRHSQTDAGYYLQDDAGNSSIALYKGGSAMFSGDVKIKFTGTSHRSLYFTEDNTDKAYLKYRGDNDKFILGSNSIDALTINTDGSATFANDVLIGDNAWADDNSVGITLRNEGQVAARRASSSTAGLFTGYAVGVSSPTSAIYSDGSAKFAGKITTNGNIVLDGETTNAQLGIRINGGADVIALKGDGSATFAGGDLSIRGSDGMLFTSGDLRAGGSVNDPNIFLRLNGSATFAGIVETEGTRGGFISGRVPIVSSDASWNVFSGVNFAGTSTSQIKGDGSATFVGGWGNDNGVLIDTNGFNVRADSGRGLGIYSGGNSDVNRTISLNGDGSATFAGTVTENASDRKFKENIVDAPAQLADVSALQLRTWDWNDLALGNEDRNDRRSMGLVAQEAELVDSNLVYDVNESEDTYKAVDYKVLTMKLLGAVKELSAKVAALEAN